MNEIMIVIHFIPTSISFKAWPIIIKIVTKCLQYFYSKDQGIN